MSVQHTNDYGFIEALDAPLPGCTCDGCSRGGDQWEQGGETFTVNSTDDPNAPGGHYLSVRDNRTGGHATAVYDADGNSPDVKANRDWRDT